MKTLIRLLGLLLVATAVFTACSKDDDPADNDLFVGTYYGQVGYTSGDETKGNQDGHVRVVKLGGDNYNFIFSDDIPSLEVTMQQGENNNLVFEDGEIGFIRITNSTLRISYAKDNQIWTAEAERE